MSEQEKKTVELPAVPDWAVKLTETVKAGFADVRAELQEVKADVTILGESQKDIQQRVQRQERRQDDFEEWRARSSERAKAEEQARSAVDLEHQAQLTHIEERLGQMTEAQTNTLVAAIEKASKTPQGQKLAQALVTFLVVLLTAATGWLMAHGGK